MADLSSGTYVNPVEHWGVWIRETQTALGEWRDTEGYKRFRDILEGKVSDLMAGLLDSRLSEAELKSARAYAMAMTDVLSLLDGVTEAEKRHQEMVRVASRRSADVERRDFVATGTDPVERQGYAVGSA